MITFERAVMIVMLVIIVMMIHGQNEIAGRYRLLEQRITNIELAGLSGGFLEH